MTPCGSGRRGGRRGGQRSDVFGWFHGALWVGLGRARQRLVLDMI